MTVELSLETLRDAMGMLHTATHCNAPQRTATYCNTLQHTATHCNAPQHTAAHTAA